MAATRTTKKAAARKPRKSTAAPKRIINRKPRARKATVSTSAAERQKGREARAKDRLAAQSKVGTEMKKLTRGGMSVQDAAKELGVPLAQARTALRKAKVNPKDRIVGTEAEVRKAVLKAKAEGASYPELRARTGLSGRTLRQYVEEAGGASTRKPRAKAGAKKPTARTRRSGAAKKAAATKAAPRARKAKPKAAAKEDAAPSGRTQGRRARRVKLTAFLEDSVWNLDSDNDEVSAGLTGHTIEVTRDFNGRSVKPTEHKVAEVVSITMHDREGRVIEFIDENHQTRFVSSREITSLK
jgi:DNA-directed RNA polymerase specialized sigma24 family protein